uniref:5-formyltetrahydrofolate cyclo-ligase n=1 Tax=Enterobius vermicularis TaxID=51028 RepID=A0A0N4UUF0_ENTVE
LPGFRCKQVRKSGSKRVRREVKLYIKSEEPVPGELTICICSKWYLDCKRISIYVSTKNEVATDSLIRDSIARQKSVFVPHFRRGSNQMDMFKLQSVEEFCNLQPTLWGIRQPLNPDSKLGWKNFVNLGPFDVVIVPGVAFTEDGHRLGHGKGYYDRFLSEHNQLYGCLPFTVGLALEHQLVKTLPTTDKDVCLNMILSANKH